MHPSLRHLDHRPWPLPEGRWTWRQNWYDLLFAHWPVPAADLRPLVPQELTIQEYDGTSWVGVVPFRMTGVMRRPFPDLPWLSAFPELNVRLYVERDGKPGVWFLSLDASNRLAVWAARRFFHLPYHHAAIDFRPGPQTYHFRSRRFAGDQTVSFEATFRPTGESFRSRPGTLEHFLTERYCLYAVSPRGCLYRGDVHHAPWTLYPADGEVDAEALLQVQGLSTAGRQPLLHFSPGVETVVWPLRKIGCRAAYPSKATTHSLIEAY